MKRYGSRVATEFTKKQIGVIYGMAKRAELKIEKWVMSDFYDAADYYGYDDNRSMEDEEREIMAILDAVFSNDETKAQELIDRFTEKHWMLMGRKTQARCDRAYLA